DGAASKTKARLRFSVSDTGIGISKEKLELVFEKFTQGDASITRQYGGTGLGLAISRRLAELMDGRMWVESNVERGSTFYFTAEFGLTKMARPVFRVPVELDGLRVLV